MKTTCASCVPAWRACAPARTVVPIRQFVDVFSSAQDQRSLGQPRGTHAEHEAVFNAIARHSSREAEQAMRVHVLNTKVRLLDSMQLF